VARDRNETHLHLPNLQALPQDQRAGAIVHNVRGFELNPLTVQAAQTAYLCVLSTFLPSKVPLKIPVQVRDLFDVTAPEDVQADLLVGNPPWVRWSSVPGSQRAKIAQCARDLGLDRLELEASVNGSIALAA